MKISIFYDHVISAAEQTGRTVGEILAMAKSAGIDGVDINNDNIARLPDMLTAIHEAGMKVVCSFQFYDWGNTEFGDLTKLKAHVANARAEGQDKILVIPGFLNDADAKALNTLLDEIGIPDTPTIDPRLDAFMKGNESVMKMISMLNQAVAYASAFGITVTMEDFDGYNAPFGRVLGLLYAMVNVPGLKFTLDTGNFAYFDEDVCDGYRLLKDHIVHVHTKDRGVQDNCANFKHKQGMASVATGDGYIPIDKLCKALSSSAYEGYFAIEHYGHNDQAAAIVKSAENLIGFIA